MVNALPHSPHSTRYVITHHVQIVFPLFTTSIIATAMFPKLSISLLTIYPCVSFHVFHSTCLLVSSSNVSFQCLLPMSPSNVSLCLLQMFVMHPSMFPPMINVSFPVSSNLSAIRPSMLPPTSLQPVSNTSLQMSSNHMSHSNMTSYHILIIFPLVTTCTATAISPNASMRFHMSPSNMSACLLPMSTHISFQSICVSSSAGLLIMFVSLYLIQMFFLRDLP